MNNLGTALLNRFERRGNLANIDRAISVEEDAVRLTPHDHPDKPRYLSSLGTALLTRFERLGNLADIDRAISVEEDAARLPPHDHPDKPRYLNNVGTALLNRFERLGNLADIDRAILVREDAVRLAPHDHPDKPRYLNNLGTVLLTRFKRLGNLADIDRAISVEEDAVRLIPHDHPDKPTCLSNLGSSLFTRFKHLHDVASLNNAILAFSAAARSSAGPSSVRLRAALQWIRCAHLIPSESLLNAYALAIDLIPQAAWLGLPLQDRHRELLVRAADVVRDAAADALARGYYNTAVERLELSRSVVWSQLLQLRTPLDELQSRDSTLANRLRQVSYELEQGSGNDMIRIEMKNDIKLSLEEQVGRYYGLAMERETILSEVRCLPGLERFLLPKTVSQLAPSAHSGPVVILNASQYGCDALVLLAESDDVLHVPLADITYDQVQKLQESLNQLLSENGRVLSPMDRAIEFSPINRSPDESFKLILSVLWKKVVRPVLDALALSTPNAGELSRVFWCPTGPFSFLPIHAAGLYDDADTGPKLSDFVISSYTPTLSALALPSHEGTTANTMCLAVVPQPASDGLTRLPGAQIEIGHIKTMLQSSPSTPVSLVESIGTVDDVLTKMKESDWIHIACHGVQNAHSPLDSGIVLAGGRHLMLRDVIKLARRRGGLAFLSACQTATGNEDLPKEAVNLATGMLLAGYGGVVSTMWSIKDSDAPEVVKSVYEQLFQDGNLPDYRQAAKALHYAVKRLREEHNVPFVSWASFVHIGL
ncbi:uncharacterized protein FIBRA_02069 [Fibroporia radiculosa]|uniref:CHAT domain-containing protein n=1 Tax=Fibroporia radiculosa TaxID=599839 RepID=J4G1C1_9APHY|nr:uncharacterized protein FIBRA_02069 [Fibroporia radiculosa]CCM00043.1 predicted protein [Fibroporia radiculosa]